MPKTEIGGYTYSTQLFRFTESVKVKAKLLKFFAPFLQSSESMDIANVLPAIIDNLDFSLFDDLCKYLQVDSEGKQIPLNNQVMRDSFWTDKQLDAYRVLAWVIWENYKDFFQKLDLLDGMNATGLFRQ